ncbi:MAG: hypothetical protein U5L03_08620 [Burkholderiaceae bacterium]|nr:hypothetical protein [Burkholderiaceae bacterium]
MPRILQRLSSALLAALLVGSCAQWGKPEVANGRWIRFDAVAQRYSIDAQQVPRGALFDELKSVAGADVRPQPEREAVVTVQGRDLDLDALVALLMPPGTRPTIRPGEREVAAVATETARPKRGEPLRPAAGAVAKPSAEVDVTPEIRRTGTIKAAADLPYAPREVSGRATKPQAAVLLRTADTQEPKKPLVARVPRSSVRVQLQFEEGVPPRVVDARAIEGRAPPQRFVTGSYLYALTAADGRVLEAGTFQDPLVEHSYLPEGQHSVGRAKSGVVGISIARENLNGAVLRVVDVSALAMPRELDERTVRLALERGKSALQLEAAVVLRRLDQEAK